jgi:hypothetical protein
MGAVLEAVSIPGEVRTVVEHHLATADRLRQIWWFPTPPESERRVYVLEVDDEALPEQGPRALAWAFSALHDYPAVAVAMVTPADWQRIESGALLLPAGWDWGRRVLVYDADAPGANGSRA